MPPRLPPRRRARASSCARWCFTRTRRSKKVPATDAVSRLLTKSSPSSARRFNGGRSAFSDHFLINKFARRGLLEKCVASDRDPAINASRRAKRAVPSLLFLHSTRHSSQAPPSSLTSRDRTKSRHDRSGECDEASGIPKIITWNGGGLGAAGACASRSRREGNSYRLSEERRAGYRAAAV